MIEHVIQLDPEQWASYGKHAHTAVFGKILPPELERISFALLAIGRDGLPMSYVTCKEQDGESLYWQFGGSFPGTKGGVGSVAAMREFLKWCSARYKRVSFLVENDNYSMLKLAMKFDFKISGIRNFKNSVLLEHLLEFSKGD